MCCPESPLTRSGSANTGGSRQLYAPYGYWLSGFETDGEQELVEAGDDARIEPVKLGTVGVVQIFVCAEWAQHSGSQRSINAFKKLREYQTNGVALHLNPVDCLRAQSTS